LGCVSHPACTCGEISRAILRRFRPARYFTRSPYQFIYLHTYSTSNVEDLTHMRGICSPFERIDRVIDIHVIEGLFPVSVNRRAKPLRDAIKGSNDHRRISEAYKLSRPVNEEEPQRHSLKARVTHDAPE